MSSLEFDEIQIKQAEEDFNTVTLPPEIRQLVVDIAGVFSQKIPMSELALRGFQLHAIRQTQKELKITAENQFSQPPEIIAKADVLTLKYLKERIQGCLRDKSESQMKLLDEAFDEVQKLIAELRNK